MMRIIFMGSGEFGLPSLRRLIDSEHELLQIVTQPARPAGRGRHPIETPVAALAARLDVPCLETPTVNEPQVVEHLAGLRPDLIVVIAFGQKIGHDLLNLPDCRLVNLHASLLPRYRGAAPVNWAILNGESHTGLTLFELNEQWDAGLIYGQVSTRITPDQTADELHDRLAEMGPELLMQVIQAMEDGTLRPIRQDDSQASRAPKLKKADGAIDWNRSAEQLRNHIHGMWSWPGAFCHILPPGKKAPERLILARVELVDTELPTPSESDPSTRPDPFDRTDPSGRTDRSSGPDPSTRPAVSPGTLLPDHSIQCGRGRIRILELKPGSGRLMSFADYANGRRLQSPAQFLNGNQL